MADPWDRERNEDGELEPMLWFSRLDQFYRPLGPERSIHRAYNDWRRIEKDREPSSMTPLAWSGAAKRWNWKERAEAWDRAQMLRRWETEQEAIDAMTKRHLRIAMGLQSAGGRSLRMLTEALQEGGARLSSGEIRHYLREGIELERITRGLPTELVDIMMKSDEELLDEYRDLIAAIGAQRGRPQEQGHRDESGGGKP